MTPARNKGSVRRGQLITTYGVGAVVAVEDESFMIAGIDRWGVDTVDIREPRLERLLGVSGFVLPPASDDDGDIPVVRFPVMHSCPSCKVLAKHRFFASFDENKCNNCDMPLIPSRFVVACNRGHIDDFPYFEWIHVGTKAKDAGKHELRLEAAGASASLRDIHVSCSCGLATTLDGAFNRGALRRIYRCRGLRPWLTTPADECDEMPRTLQRGASGVWFAVVASALSIPPWSDGAYRILNRHWTVLEYIPDDALEPTIKGMRLDKTGDYSVEDLAAAVRRRREEESDTSDAATLRAQEFEAFVKGKAEASSHQDFVCIPAQGVGPLSSEWFQRVMLAKRLREVRALTAFTRVVPPSPADDPQKRHSPLSATPLGWLPAVEVIGEGVFLELPEKPLRVWESRPSVLARATALNSRYEHKFQAIGAEPDRAVTPRLLLVHALAHALIGQWALDCGYPAASLRERLYVSDSSGGLLIYTATSDSAGSLGGVVSQADGLRLDEALVEAIARMSWCSSDPLCSEAEAAGVDSLNLSACHACILLPEVSCEESNLLLDRATLVGTVDDPNVGYFSALLEEH